MKLLDYLAPQSVKAPMKATTKRDAIDELVDVLAATGVVHDPQALKDAVWQREQTRTTGIGFGLAIPHGKCAGVDNLAIALGKPAEPMHFESIDNQPVRLIVLLASPLDRTSDHIQALAHISRLMNLEEFREKIYEAETSEQVYRLIKEQEQA